jgi:hypothetical protein
MSKTGIARAKQAYRLRVEGRLWREIGACLDPPVTPGAAHALASGYAQARGLALPVGRKGGPMGLRCHGLRAGGLSWAGVAARVSRAERPVLPETARTLAFKYANRHGLAWPLTGRTWKDRWALQAQCYSLRLSGLAWRQITQATGKSAACALSAARSFARRNRLPWPPQEVALDTEREEET